MNRHYISPFRPERLPDGVQFYEGLGVKVGRPNRAGWCGVIGDICPSHRSKSKQSFAVHGDGAFVCRGCGAKGGSVIAFVMLRDNLDFKAAAQLLGCWDNSRLTTAERLQLNAARAERDRAREQAANAAEHTRRARLTIRDEVHTAARIQKEVSARLSELRRGAAATCDGEEEMCWAVMAHALDDWRDAEARYLKAAGLECTADD